ncbi:MAG: hypothetical protein QXZ68_05035 [Candidatus Bathyarchaeia archaeon]
MPYPDELKQALINHILAKRIKLGIEGKIYSPEELAEHVREESEIGKKLIEAVIRGTVERLGKQ